MVLKKFLNIYWSKKSYESVESVLDGVEDGGDSQVVIQELLLTPLA